MAEEEGELVAILCNAKVLYAYKASRETELNLAPGQIIPVIKKYENGWWVGDLGGQVGLFPASYTQEIPMEITNTTIPQCSGAEMENAVPDQEQGNNFVKIDKTPSQNTLDKAADVPTPRLRKQSIVKPNTDALKVRALYDYKGEVSFVKGDEGYLFDKVDENWYRGEFNGQKGIYPKTFVQIVEDSYQTKVKAVYDFSAETDREISFKSGEVITLLKKLENSGWWKGEIHGKVGFFPYRFVTEIPTPRLESSNSVTQDNKEQSQGEANGNEKLLRKKSTRTHKDHKEHKHKDKKDKKKDKRDQRKASRRALNTSTVGLQVDSADPSRAVVILSQKVEQLQQLITYDKLDYSTRINKLTHEVDSLKDQLNVEKKAHEDIVKENKELAINISKLLQARIDQVTTPSGKIAEPPQPMSTELTNAISDLSSSKNSNPKYRPVPGFRRPSISPPEPPKDVNTNPPSRPLPTASPKNSRIQSLPPPLSKSARTFGSNGNPAPAVPPIPVLTPNSTTTSSAVVDYPVRSLKATGKDLSK